MSNRNRSFPRLAVALAFLWLLRTVSAAQDEMDWRSAFRWRQRLRAGVQAPGLYKVKLTNPVYDGCRQFPDDLRVLDTRGVQWPWFLWVPREKRTVQTLPVEALNAMEVQVPARYVRRDLRVAPDPRSGQRLAHDRVEIRSSGDGFIRRVEVYGSEDGDTWGLLGEGYLLRHARDVKAENRVVRYGRTELPRLELRVFPNARDADETFRIHHVDVQRVTVAAGERETVALTPVSPGPEGEEKDAQMLLFDTGAENRPVDRIEIHAAEEEFVRPVRVYGRNGGTNEWRRVADGAIHRLGRQEKRAIDLAGCAFRFLKVAVYHYDDQPLTGVRLDAEAVPRYVVFEALADDTASFYYGADRVERPRYDLRRRKNENDLKQARLVGLGKRVPNPRYRGAGWGPWGAWLAALAVGAVSLVVIWVILGMMRRQARMRGSGCVGGGDRGSR